MARSNRRDVVEVEGYKRSVLERLKPRTAKVHPARRTSEETSAAGRNDSFTADRLLDKWAVEERTSLDITTIYRKIKIGTSPLLYESACDVSHGGSRTSRRGKTILSSV